MVSREPCPSVKGVSKGERALGAQLIRAAPGDYKKYLRTLKEGAG